MPASQSAATERRNERMMTHEPPKLKTTLKTPPKQATNPLQFVKVGPCSLYRTAQEQLQKVQEVKKIKQEIRDDPEDWQSNLDNWKSSRRKRQEHIIERVVEVKKLELEEHDRQRRRSKTFSEMMEERGNRGRKLSISLAMYHEEDANDLSDLGIGTSSGKSSVSGDTHDDTHSVLSDRDSEIEKNHSDVDNVASESVIDSDITTSSTTTTATTTTTKKPFGNGFHSNHNHNNQEYDSATTATTSSPEPEEYTYEGAIRGYVSRVSQNIPRRSLASLDAKLESSKSSTNGSKTSLNDDAKSAVPVVKVDILKRREIFEKASQKNSESKANNRLSGDFTNTKSIKERLSNLEKQKHDTESNDKTGKALSRLSGDMSSIRERLSHLEKQASERENKNSAHRKLSTEELETVRPLRERLSTLEKYSSSDESSAPGTAHESRHNGELSARTIKDRLNALDAARSKEAEKRSSAVKHSLCFRDQENRIDTSTPSERSSSPDSEYRVPRAAFHRSLDSLDADASSGPDTFERVQSLEELDYGRRYPASSSSAELLNDTDREDSGIHTADVSCSVSQADEPVDEDIVHTSTIIERQQEVIQETPEEPRDVETVDDTVSEQCTAGSVNDISTSASQPEAVVTKKGTADTSGELSTNKSQSQAHTEVTNSSTLRPCPASSRPIVYQSPKVPPRRTPPETLPKPKLPIFKDQIESKADSQSAKESAKFCSEEQDSKRSNDETNQSPSKEDSSKTTTSSPSPDSAIVDSCPLSPVRTAIVPTNLQLDLNATSSKELPKTTPVTSPRALSKIPTPLPRKTIGAKSSPTSSTSSLSPPISPSSPKTPSIKVRSIKSPTNQSSPSPQFPKASEIPVPVSPSSTSEQSSKHVPSPKHQVTVGEETLAAERRRTVVEICEKVVVPRGKTPTSPPVTPFITVDRVGEKQSSTTEEPIVTEKADEEEASTICQTSSPVVHEEHEGKETAMIETFEPPRKSIEESIDAHDAPEKEVANVPAAERPTTLTLGKPEIQMMDTMNLLSPVSPISKQILPLNLSSDEEIVTGLSFPLGPPTSVEPPKEKPPPPPVDVSDEENLPIEPLKRLNSTRRIKKELRTRRSDFLGIEGVNDDELERELTLTKPPDMAAILAEERRIEQLHRRSYDTDSNYEQDSSHERDSGVELGHAEDWTKQPVSPDMSQHSRQSSEPFGASVTSSEEDEITKKEREIIEVLEKEEQWRYGNNREMNSDLGEKLAHKLRELEEEKMQLERERAQETALRRQEETLRKNEDNMRKQEETLRKQQEETARQQEAARAEAEAKRAEEMRQKEEELRVQAEQLRIQNEIEEERRIADARRIEEKRIRAMENQIREQENTTLSGAGLNDEEDEFASGEVLRVERELLQLEQEELKRQRNNLAYREQKQLKLAEQLQEQWKSLQDVAHSSANNIQPFKSQPPVNYRSSMPNLQLQDAQRRRPPPPPIPPAKPLRLVDQRQRDVTIRNSRIPSADSIPQQVDASLRHSASVTTLSSHAGQQMSRQTLQALSAVPRPRIVQSDQWVQRRKSDVPRGAHDLNYQHWLIQEAEQRRISEKNQRSPGRKSQMHVTGTSVPYATAPTRTDSKPLPDSIIQTLTQRVQNRAQEKPLPPRRRLEHSTSQEHLSTLHQPQQHVLQQQKSQQPPPINNENQEKMLSVSGKKKCSHCGDELGRGAAMIIESLRLFYHMECFKCCVCHVRLGDGLMGTDVRVRNHKLHCHNCYSSDDGVKFSCV
ncbi:calponin homology domain-containing protein DDB_G0272472 isoform X1 [Osmia bicornis bicornis]|uniref:calponin homology domain-containing protein DDB_G0272472 isoform X1 n=1 Tax=Osmia bicornis bicornis TaxID=1437191 RepID=UPI001EAED8C3|nr:calponin homology domain-containing protein DDB_G0272472 isoform X1 [Osmia bicornis bicornis]XP_029044916.2 calponin homology domain-containing protein DDB_G0272472 isoform X1 [Osmia bicornis bicornis]XP_029044917.2 calponin homology domain-containing protein DDB_G0272472 isoform X1 [Osmia bicornis bicornis]XP_029044918.2 calponin homology domain-containing protein DDB_G0272472 isoform X1 [Osmia bicornis bicornis]